jgi:hypothetical protein
MWVRGFREAVIRKHYAMPNEDLILDENTLADERVRRDLASSTNRRVLLNLDERAYSSVIANGATVEIDE